MAAQMEMPGHLEDEEHEGERILLRGRIQEKELTRYYAFIGLIAFISLFPVYVVLLPFIFYGIRTSVETIEVFLTESAVVYKRGYFACCCCCWSDMEKTVPLEKVQDVAWTKGCIENCFGLESLYIQTAGNSSQQVAELTVTGLHNARGFRSAVLEARRALARGQSTAAAVESAGHGAGDDIEAGAGQGEGSPLLATLRSIDGSVKKIERHIATKV